MTDIVNSTPEDVNTSQENIDFSASDFGPASSVPERTEPEPEINPAPASTKPKSWQENKKLAALILVIGLVIVGVVFYFLFSSAGII